MTVILVGGGAFYWWSKDTGSSVLKPPDRRELAVSHIRSRALTDFIKSTPVVGPAGELPTNHDPIPSLPPTPRSFVPTIPSLSGSDLQRRVEQVEEQANFDLEQLVDLLDLDEKQKDRIFGALVSHSPHFLPAMQIVGLSEPASEGITPTPDSSALTPPGEVPRTDSLLDAVASHLNPDQQLELANADLDRQAWWEEIIPHLLPDGDTPALGGSAQSGGREAADSLPLREKSGTKTGGDPLLLGE